MKEYNNESVSLGDCFLVESGANASGKKGEQVAVVTKRTGKNMFCCKFSIKQKFKIVAKKYKLEESRIIRKIDPAEFDTWQELYENLNASERRQDEI